MKILDRYCAKEFARHFFLTVASFVALYVIVDFFEKIRMFLSNRATVFQMLSFFAFSIPMIFWQILPACVLIASLITFGNLSRYNELTAMKACGVSLYRIAVPVVAMSAGIAMLAFLVSEFITPYANQRADHIKLVEVQKREMPGSFKQNQLWYRGQAGIYSFKVFDSHTNILQGITIYYLDEKLNLIKRVDAQQGEWQGGSWILHQVITTSFPPDSFPEMVERSKVSIDIPEEPDDFKTIQKKTEYMGFLELRNYVREIRANGYNATVHLVDMYGKLAFPAVNIIMALIGIAMSLQGQRRGSTAQGVIAGIIIGFSYWLVFAFTISLGHAGRLPPLFSAWSANILFGLAACLLFLRVRT